MNQWSGPRDVLYFDGRIWLEVGCSNNSCQICASRIAEVQSKAHSSAIYDTINYSETRFDHSNRMCVGFEARLSHRDKDCYDLHGRTIFETLEKNLPGFTFALTRIGYKIDLSNFGVKGRGVNNKILKKILNTTITMTPKEIINNPEFTGLTAHEILSLAHQTKEQFDILKIQTRKRATELENSRLAPKMSYEEIQKDREITRQINELWMTCNNKESEYRSLKKLHIFRTLTELTRFNKDEVFEIVDMIGSCNEYQTGLFKSYVKDACERHYSQSIILEKTKPFDRLLECCDYLSTTHLRSMIMSRSVRVIEHFKKSGEQIDFDSDDRTDLIVTFFFGLNQEYDDLINEGYPVCVNLLTKDRAEIHLGFFSQKGLDYYNMHLAEFINPLLSKKIYTWEEAINIIHQIECVCKEQNDE